MCVQICVDGTCTLPEVHYSQSTPLCHCDCCAKTLPAWCVRVPPHRKKGVVLTQLVQAVIIAVLIGTVFLQVRSCS